MSAILESLIHLPRPGAPSPALTQAAPQFSLSRPPPPFPLVQEGLTSFFSLRPLSTGSTKGSLTRCTISAPVRSYGNQCPAKKSY